MTTIDDQAKLVTAIQTALRKAKAERNSKSLSAAAGMIDGHEFLSLPEAAQQDLLHQYAGAMLACTGALSP